VSIELPDEITRALVVSIQKYFRTHLDEEIGELKAGLVLDFCLREIGPSVYNQAIRDAQAYMQVKTADLDGTCFEPEMTYWKSPGVPRKPWAG
jgi:uncharacterized protein (DUF2164 family)